MAWVFGAGRRPRSAFLRWQTWQAEWVILTEQADDPRAGRAGDDQERGLAARRPHVRRAARSRPCRARSSATGRSSSRRPAITRTCAGSSRSTRPHEFYLALRRVVFGERRPARPGRRPARLRHRAAAGAARARPVRPPPLTGIRLLGWAAMRIDLHAHSTASDGTDSPAELVAAASAAGLDVVAITDHDTTAGWDEAFAARPAGLTIVPGVEFSCVHHGPDGRRVSLHLLAYLVDRDDPAISAEWARLRDSRRTRGRDDGATSWSPTATRSAGRRCARSPATARWAARTSAAPSSTAGVVAGRRHRVRATAVLAAAATTCARSTPTCSTRCGWSARPAGCRCSRTRSRGAAARSSPTRWSPRWRTAGLVGLEVDHPDHDADDRAHAAGLARDLGLIGTGSSDYHGSNKTTRLGDAAHRPGRCTSSCSRCPPRAGRWATSSARTPAARPPWRPGSRPPAECAAPGTTA